MFEVNLAKVEEQRQAKRYTDGQEGGDRQPEIARWKTAPFAADKNKKHDRRDEHIQAEESTDPIGEKLMDKQREIESVEHEPWQELAIGQNEAEGRQYEVNVSQSHGATPLDLGVLPSSTS